MALRSEKRRIATVIVAAFLVVGTGAVVTGQTDAGDHTAFQETTTVGEDGSEVSIQSLSAPSEVQAGVNFTVSADMVNRGDTEAVRRVSYRIGGNVVESKFVQIPASETETITFNVTGANTTDFPSGTFTHGVFTDGAEATAELTITAPGETATAAEETTVEEETTVTTVEETAEVTTTEADTAARTANITFENQSSNGTTVTVQSVTVPEGSFVVIHDYAVVEGEAIDSIVGTSDYLDAGTNQNVTVRLNESLDESQQLVAVVYRDSNDNQEFDFATSNRTVDGPYTRQGSQEAVNGIAVIDVTERTTNETA